VFLVTQHTRSILHEPPLRFVNCFCGSNQAYPNRIWMASGAQGKGTVAGDSRFRVNVKAAVSKYQHRFRQVLTFNLGCRAQAGIKLGRQDRWSPALP
jgi:hypothetical protein